MIRMVLMVILQSMMLVGAQFFLKLGVNQIGKFEWSWSYFKSILLNWQLSLAGVCGFLALALWVSLLKKYEFSLVYPLTSISYIFGLLLAFFVLHEVIPYTRWIGVIIVMIGVFFIIK